MWNLDNDSKVIVILNKIHWSWSMQKYLFENILVFRRYFIKRYNLVSIIFLLSLQKKVFIIICLSITLVILIILLATLIHWKRSTSAWRHRTTGMDAIITLSLLFNLQTGLHAEWIYISAFYTRRLLNQLETIWYYIAV